MSEQLFQPRSLEELDLRFPPELEHISASSLKMAVRCEEQWRQRYVLGIKAPPGLSMLQGRADHKAIEFSMVQKVDTHVDLPTREVQDRYVEELEIAVDSSGGLAEIEVRDADTPQARQRAYDQARVHGQDVVASYHQLVAPQVQPLAVEKEFRLAVPELPVEVLGYIDLVGEIPLLASAEKVIIDRKRRARRSLKIEPEWSLQAEIYQLAEPLPHDWHLSVTTKTPQVVAFEPELRQELPPRARSERLLQQLVAKIGWLYQRFGPDEPWPTTGKMHPWACGYCGYRDRCWGWKEEV